MNHKRFYFPFLMLSFILSNCEQATELKDTDTFTIKIQNLSDEQYPDNPDIDFRTSNYEFQLFNEAKIIVKTNDSVNFHFLTTNNDTLKINNINVLNILPTVPYYASNDSYLTYLSLINQEWNRNQVKLNLEMTNANELNFTRVDLARNCLNAYLWEIIVYKDEDGKTLPYSHGWFSFPKELYMSFFEITNPNLTYHDYMNPLENWVDPENKQIIANNFRKIVSSNSIKFTDSSNTNYPIKSERLRKRKEVIYPVNFSSMCHLQNDSSLFATFSPPGIYNKKDPRKTELGRFDSLVSCEWNKVKVVGNEQQQEELILTFKNLSDQRITKMIIGGIQFNEFPILPVQKANDGWMNSMGFGNHSFYENYETFLNKPSKNSTYYAYLTDENDNWLDSHKIGIDGPLFHFSDTEQNRLHLWLLSFERHALVGHYIIEKSAI